MNLGWRRKHQGEGAECRDVSTVLSCSLQLTMMMMMVMVMVGRYDDGDDDNESDCGDDGQSCTPPSTSFPPPPTFPTIAHTAALTAAHKKSASFRPAIKKNRYQAKGLFFETPNVSWRDGCFNVALPRQMHEAAMAKAAEVEFGSELMLRSRDAAFEFVGKRDDGALADVYRQHVR